MMDVAKIKPKLHTTLGMVLLIVRKPGFVHNSFGELFVFLVNCIGEFLHVHSIGDFIPPFA